jgi:hypothetical protein
MVIVRYVYGKFPEYVCVERGGLYYRVDATLLQNTNEAGFYAIEEHHLIDGSPTLRYDF